VNAERRLGQLDELHLSRDHLIPAPLRLREAQIRERVGLDQPVVHRVPVEAPRVAGELRVLQRPRPRRGPIDRVEPHALEIVGELLHALGVMAIRALRVRGAVVAHPPLGEVIDHLTAPGPLAARERLDLGLAGLARPSLKKGSSKVGARTATPKGKR